MDNIIGFQIKKANIIDIDLDIKDAIMEINIYESIDEIHYHGTMAIIDNYGLIEDFKLQGNESMELELLMYNKDSSDTYEINLFNIDKINLPKNGSGNSVIVVTFVSKGYYATIDKRYSEHHEGNHTAIIESLFKRIGESINVIDESASASPLIIPNLKFNQSINFLLNKTVSHNNEKFYVYQTLSKGYIAQSISNMKEQDSIIKYSYRIRDVSPTETQKNQGDYTNILDYEVVNYKGVGEDRLSGYNSGSSEVFNIYSRISEKRFVSSGEGGEVGAKHIFRVTSGVGLSTFGSQELDKYHKTNKQMHETNIRLMVPGNIDVAAGNKITIQLPTHSVLTNTEDDINHSISDEYLVINTHHKFTMDTYVTAIEAIRIIQV